LVDDSNTVPDSFRERIRHPNLLRLYDYWAARRRGRSFPSRQDIDPVEFRFALGNVTLIDVLHNPLRFRFRLVGSLMAQRMGFDLTGKMVDEVEDAVYRDNIITAYREIVEGRRPNTVLYERTYEGKRRRFEVLRLPLAADGETIDMLLLCPQYFDKLPERSPLAPSPPGGEEPPTIIES
jgi:hypothetical protein